MKALSLYEDHLGLWKDELRGWVPDVIFDAHVHLGPEGIASKISPERLKEPLSTFTHLPWEELSEFYKDLFSGKTISGLIAFGVPLHEVDTVAANTYIVGLMEIDPRVKGFIIPDLMDTSSTIKQFKSAQRRGARFRGVKPYFDLLYKSNYETTMSDLLPYELLDFMDSESLILMLHTPGIGMGLRENQDYLTAVAEKYPRIRIVLAHMGRYIEPEQFFSFMESDLLDCPQVYLEMSSASRSDVYEKVLERRDLWTRLLFGSDMPFGAISGVESDEGPPGMFLTRDDYTWSDKKLNEQFRHLRTSLTYNTYHTIKALKDATERMGIAGHECRQLKSCVFHENALRLFGQA